jgi:hypothetical protein
MTPPSRTNRRFAFTVVLGAVVAFAGAGQVNAKQPPGVVVQPQINPWNQTRVAPFNPALNPFNNPFQPNPAIINALNNPFAPNPLLGNVSPNNNPLSPNPANSPFVPFTTYSPPVAIQQPGAYIWRGPNLQVNPWAGTIYRPLSGTVQTANGNTFYRVPGTGLPTFSGAYSPGTGLYYDPQSGAFINPASGVISRPGVTNVFIPWIPR